LQFGDYYRDPDDLHNVGGKPKFFFTSAESATHTFKICEVSNMGGAAAKNDGFPGICTQFVMESFTAYHWYRWKAKKHTL